MVRLLLILILAVLLQVCSTQSKIKLGAFAQTKKNFGVADVKAFGNKVTGLAQVTADKKSVTSVAKAFASGKSKSKKGGKPKGKSQKPKGKPSKPKGRKDV